MKRLYLVVEHRQPERVIRLQSELSSLRSEIVSLKKMLSTLEQRFGYEVNLNAELIDLLNSYHVPYRDKLDFRKFPF